MGNNTHAEQAKSRPGLILALITLPVFIGALDLTIVSAVLPDVILDLEIPLLTGGDDAAWVISGYLLAYTVSVAIMGPCLRPRGATADVLHRAADLHPRFVVGGGRDLRTAHLGDALGAADRRRQT